jgi:hypothetical protein
MFCAPGLVFGGIEGVSSRFHVLRARTRCRLYQGGRVQFSSFALQDSISAVPRASCPVFMFCAPEHVFDDTEDVGSRFHVLRARTYFRRKQGRRVPFSSCALLESFLAVPWASGPVFKFCAPGLIFSGTKGVGTGFSYFARPDSFSAVPRASGPVLMYCAHELVFDGTEGVGSRYHVLRSQTHFQRYRGRRLSFSYFALLNSFSAAPRASAPIFMFCAPGLFFDGTEGVGSRFHVLRARTHFRRYRGRRAPFSCFSRPNSFSMVSRASCPVFMFFAPELIFCVFEVVGSRFLVLCAWTRFRRYRGRRHLFSCFVRPYSFLAVPRA